MILKKMFGLNEDFVRRQCNPREVQSDSNKSFYPEKDFFDVCIEGAVAVSEDKLLVDKLRESLGQGSGI